MTQDAGRLIRTSNKARRIMFAVLPVQQGPEGLCKYHDWLSSFLAPATAQSRARASRVSLGGECISRKSIFSLARTRRSTYIRRAAAGVNLCRGKSMESSRQVVGPTG